MLDLFSSYYCSLRSYTIRHCPFRCYGMAYKMFLNTRVIQVVRELEEGLVFNLYNFSSAIVSKWAHCLSSSGSLVRTILLPLPSFLIMFV